MSAEEVRHTIRGLVSIIQSASRGDSPVDDAQLSYIRKVVRLLSLSEEQVQAMSPAEQEQVTSIRASAIQKMKLAQGLRTNGLPPAPPQPGSYGSLGGVSPFGASPSPLGAASPSALQHGFATPQTIPGARVEAQHGFSPVPSAAHPIGINGSVGAASRAGGSRAMGPPPVPAFPSGRTKPPAQQIGDGQLETPAEPEPMDT